MKGHSTVLVLRLARPDEAFFWAMHQGAEFDLLTLKGERRVGVEFERADSPRVTRWMSITGEDPRLDELDVFTQAKSASG